MFIHLLDAETRKQTAFSLLNNNGGTIRRLELANLCQFAIAFAPVSTDPLRYNDIYERNGLKTIANQEVLELLFL